VRILIIDDEPHIIRALTVLFEKSGYIVRSAYNGADGLVKLQAEKPDIAIVDVMMPGVGGLELLQTWRDHNHEAEDIQFIMLTASCDEEIAACVQSCKNVQLVAKPFSPRGILHMVQETAARNLVRAGPV
jgi:CheY-like chemotaxis protein